MFNLMNGPQSQVGVSLDTLKREFNSLNASRPRNNTLPQMSEYARKISALTRSMVEFCLKEKGCGVQRGLPMVQLCQAAANNRIYVAPYCFQIAPWLDAFSREESSAMLQVQPNVIMQWGMQTTAFYNEIASHNGL